MIERYALFSIDKLTDRYSLKNGVPKGVKRRYNASPTQTMPVVVAKDAVNHLSLMQWGLVPEGSKNANSVFRYKTFNTNVDKVFSRKLTDHAIRHARCIVPANGYFMWEKRPEGKLPYFVSDPNAPLLSLAGIYSQWTDPAGEVQQAFSILMTEANKAIPLTHNLMPVIVHTADEARWLDASLSDFSTIMQLLRPYEGSALTSNEVSPQVSSKKLDTPDLIAPTRSI